jgi:hypothetical protein
VEILDEIESDTWHILTTAYTHQQFIENILSSGTRFDLANRFVALNALEEVLVIRLARLGDKRRDARSVWMLLKCCSFQESSAVVKDAAKSFLSLVEPVLKIRHEQIAHMKPGVRGSLEPKDLPPEVLKAIKALIQLIDVARGKPIGYFYKVGSMEPVIDLKASVIAGEMVTKKSKL